ncbi:transcription factor [Vermiconidia calcicola]|uniref:Transcription factor n=1 Tax=Vermiconidia calcicola TaxID=1690605 RepID=A0ACC3MP61_9PEZI|nr:transcription factor [Vermiconidia calcicola]
MATPKRKLQLRHAPKNRVLVLHHLASGERAPHVEKARGLDVAKNAEDVVYPAPEDPPIPGLPVFKGYTCEAPHCDYLCVTGKRMQAHWRTNHARLYQAHGVKRCCSRQCTLQTFFHGINLKYFIVADCGNVNICRRSSPSTESPDPSLQRSLPGLDVYATSIEWLLAKQFSGDSYSTVLPVIGSKDSWRDQMLQISASYRFLRYAMLSVTANHIAFECPESRQRYGCEADRFRGEAIKALSACIPTKESENFFAAFNFTRLMVLCSLARVQLSRLEGRDEPLGAKSILPDYIRVQQYGRALVWPLRGGGRIVDAMQGPPKRLYATELMPESNMIYNPYDAGLQTLALALQALADSEDGVNVDSICLEALHLLRRIWAIPYRDNVTGFRDATLMWTARVTKRYLDLVEAHDPVALVIFAHFCMLCSCSEERYWYMKGLAESILSSIAPVLGPQWHAWIAWPISVVLGTADVGDTSPTGNHLGGGASLSGDRHMLTMPVSRPELHPAPCIDTMNQSN